MKKKLLLIPTLSCLFSLSACFYYAPLKVKYEGKTYKRNWYTYFEGSKKDLHVCIPYTEQTPLFEKSKYSFWYTEEYRFKLLYSEYVDSQMWLPDVYVEKDELKTAQNFYRDVANYDYYIGPRLDKENQVKIDSEEEKEAIEYTIKVISNAVKPASVIKTTDKPSKHNLSVHRKSKDGLFMTHKEQLVAYNEKIYQLKVNDGKDNSYTLGDLGDYGVTLYSMFNKYNLL